MFGSVKNHLIAVGLSASVMAGCAPTDNEPVTDAGVVDDSPTPDALRAPLDAVQLCTAVQFGGGTLVALALTNRCSEERTIRDGFNSEVLDEACSPGAPGFDIYERALDEPTISFDVERMVECQEAGRDAIAQWESGVADVIDDTANLCQGLVTGTATAGADCFVDWMCADGLSCEFVSADNAFRCLPPASVGESCHSSSTHPRSCEEGLDCVDDICLTQPTEGEACGNTVDVDCADGLRCNVDSSVCEDDPSDCAEPCSVDEACVDNACVALPASGDACTQELGCAACSVCRPDDGGNLLCQPPGALGASCSFDAHCVKDAYCSDDGVCTALGAVGAVCDSSSSCESNLFCDDGVCTSADDVTCDVRRDCGVGDSCTYDFQCSPDDGGLLCDDGVCVAAPSAGNACTSLGGCADDLYCDDNDMCQPQKDEGQACVVDTECSTTVCADGVCAVEGQSCLHSKELFAQLIFLSGLWVPAVRRRRARRRESKLDS